jgi:hypothetical protein
MKRHRSLELVRGAGVALMVFLHGAVYHYGGIFELDFQNPPLIVTIFGFLLMWAGLFAVLSGATHVIRISERIQEGVPIHLLRRWELMSAAGLLLLGLLYFTLVGPSVLDFESRTRVNSLAVGLIRDGSFSAPALPRWIYMNTLFMVGFCTLFAGPLFLWLARHKDPHSKQVKLILASAAVIVFAISWLRIPLYTLFEEALAQGNYAFVLATFWLLNKHDPLLPALGFALCGTLFGLVVFTEASKRQMALPLLLGCLLLLSSAVASFYAPDTMLDRNIDWTWYTIMLAQGGVILMGLVAVHRWLDRPSGGSRRENLLARTLTRFSRASLTVLFGETLLAEAASSVLSVIVPVWNVSLAAAIVFGAASVAAWALILRAWEQAGFRGSIEWLWVRTMTKLHRPSTKLAGISEGRAHASGTTAGHR